MTDRSAKPPVEPPPGAALAALAARRARPRRGRLALPALAWLLARRAGFPVLRRGTVARDLARAALLAAPFIAAVVVLDRVAAFPAGINVPVPPALAFYPFIACVVETVFDLAPLALLLTRTVARPRLPRRPPAG